MKKTTLLFIFLSFAIISFAGKSYDITITVTDYHTDKIISGAKVSTYSKRELNYKGVTDQNGQLILKGIDAKKLEIIVEVNNTIYELKTEYIINSKRNDLNREIKVQYVLEEEQRMYRAIDDQYKGEIVGYDSDSLSSNSDTTGIIIAEYPGGKKEMMKFLAKNTRYPEVAMFENIQGKVNLSFYIQKDGRITNVKVVKGVHTMLDNEAIRAVRKLPNWKPATRFGEPIKSVFYLPVNFKFY